MLSLLHQVDESAMMQMRESDGAFFMINGAWRR